MNSRVSPEQSGRRGKTMRVEISVLAQLITEEATA